MRRSLCLGVLATASGKVYFSETFGSGWEERWSSSEWPLGLPARARNESRESDQRSLIGPVFLPSTFEDCKG